VIHQFIASWPLFQFTYMAGWLISLLLSLLGVLVVARNQIFVGAAVSQASTLGIAVTLWAFSHHYGEHSGDHYPFAAPLAAVLFSILAALITVPSGNGGRETSEAISGWVFLLSASFSILVVSHSPLGLEEIYRLLSSSIIGATQQDIFTFGLILAITVGFLWFRHRPLLLFALDPAMAVAVGLNLTLWSRLTAIWLGIGVGLALQVSGMLFTFG
jgi:ABC-type Mn2+/Zn2+ transport system permease subunit